VADTVDEWQTHCQYLGLTPLTLGKVLHRPTIFPMPAFAARLAFGEMADELFLSSARVQPARLLESGYQFQHADLDGALRHLLAR
jgi:NAD dependent epimerase/dehydratase family enzyme